MTGLNLKDAYPEAKNLIGTSERSATQEAKVIHANGQGRDINKLLPLKTSNEYQSPQSGEMIEPTFGANAMIEADIAAGDGWRTAAEETHGVFDVLRGKRADDPSEASTIKTNTTEGILNPHARTGILKRS